MVLLLLWKPEIEKRQSLVYHDIKGLHHVG